VRNGKDMSRHGMTLLFKIGGKTDTKVFWAAVRQLTGQQQLTAAVDGITAESLNDHLSAISDYNNTAPTCKHLSNPIEPKYISEWFFSLFLIISIPQPLVFMDFQYCFTVRVLRSFTNLSQTCLISLSPPQLFHCNGSRPAFDLYPRSSNPKQHADFWPISVTPVLTRVMERIVVRRFFYPAFLILVKPYLFLISLFFDRLASPPLLSSLSSVPSPRCFSL